MDTECKISVEALDMMGFDNRNVQLVALQKPWHLMIDQEITNMSTAGEADGQKPDEIKTATISGEGKDYSVAVTEDFPVLIDFEKICLWDHDGDLKIGIRMEDPDYMKKRLMEWVQAVAGYVRFLHASADIS